MNVKARAEDRVCILCSLISRPYLGIQVRNKYFINFPLNLFARICQYLFFWWHITVKWTFPIVIDLRQIIISHGLVRWFSLPLWSLFQSLEPRLQNAECSIVSLEAQCWGDRNRWIFVAHWSTSIACLLSSRLGERQYGKHLRNNSSDGLASPYMPACIVTYVHHSQNPERQTYIYIYIW